MCRGGMGLLVFGLIYALLSLSDCSIIAAQTLLLEAVLSAERRVCIPWPVAFSRMTLLALLLYLWRWRQGFHRGGVMWL